MQYEKVNKWLKYVEWSNICSPTIRACWNSEFELDFQNINLQLLKSWPLSFKCCRWASWVKAKEVEKFCHSVKCDKFKSHRGMCSSRKTTKIAHDRTTVSCIFRCFFFPQLWVKKCNRTFLNARFNLWIQPYPAVPTIKSFQLGNHKVVWKTQFTTKVYFMYAYCCK